MKVSKLPFLLLPLLLLLASCSRDPKSLVATGNKYFDRAKYKEASIMYRKALQKDRKFGDAWYRLGLVDAKLGAWGEALSSYQRAVELDPANSDAAANLADLYLASYLFSSTHPKESLAETKELAKGLLKRDPNSFDGLRLAGYVALMENNTAEAQKDFETANRSRPWQPAVVLTLCEIYSAGEHAPEAESLAREMISHQKQDGEIYDFLVRYYLIHKRVGDAEAVLVEKIANNPKVGPYVIELARFYQATGRRDAVEATLARLTSNANSYPDGWMLVGSYYLTNGDADAALQAFTKGESVDAKNKTAYQKRRVETLVVKGRTDEASSLAGEILKANPDDPEAIALSAIIGIQTGKPDQLQRAIDDLGPLIGKYPSVPATPMLRYHLARAYVAKANLDAGDADPTRKLKELDQARNQLEQAFQGGRFTFTPARLLLAQVDMEGREYARVTQLADDVLRTEPGNLRARLMRTDALARMGEYDKAEAELDQVLAINPNIEDAQLQLARVYIAEKKFAQAEAILEKGQSTDPRAFMELVDLKVAEGKTADAIQMLSRQSAANPNSLMLRFALANVEMNARKYDEAIGVFRQMLDRGSGLTASGKAQVYSRIGTAQEGKGDYKGAVASYTEASKLMPNDATPMVELGAAYGQSGQTDMARSSYESALKLDPQNAAAMNNLAYIKADEQVDLDRALSLAEQARQKMPDDIDVQDTLALVYVRKNLTDEALRMERELVDKRPNNPLYHYHLALALFQKGDKPSAKKELSTALALKPTPADQARIRELMGKIG